MIENFSFDLQTETNTPNYSDLNSLTFLSQQKSIKVTKADKGGCIIIIGTKDYDNLVLTHLNDTSTYKLLTSDMNIITLEKIKHLTNEYKGCLRDDEIGFLQNFTPRTATFYVLPKIHKSNTIKNCCLISKTEYINIGYCPLDLPSRPIVNNINCPTSHLSFFLDKLLEPFISLVDGYVKNSYDFLSKLPRRVNNNSLFVSLDVTSLYTVIPHNIGLTAVEFWLSKYSSKLDSRFSISFILNALEIILRNNSFKYKKQHFLQINGVAMGTMVAPKYAHLVMAYIETLLKSKCTTILGENKAFNFFQNYYRFLDDIFVITNLSLNDVKQIIKIFNSIHEAFKFTHEISHTHCTFLDISIYKVNDTLVTDIYYKPTDAKRYLHFHSYHPRHIKRNLPYCLASRISKIVSDPKRKQQQFAVLKNRLLYLKYPERLINDAINRSRLNSSKKDEQPHEIMPFCYTYSATNQQVTRSKLLPLFNKFLINSFKNRHVRFISCRRQPPNTFTYIKTAKKQFSINKCLRPRCKTCPIINTCNGSTTVCNKNVRLNQHMNCVSCNIIYCLQCTNCQQYYIGQTSQQLCKRVTLHRQHINDVNYSIQPVSHHLRACGKGFTVTPLFQIPQKSNYLLLKMEHFFIRYLQPTLNGLLM